MKRSQNGYPAPPSDLRKWIVPGTKRHFSLVDGWGGFLLVVLALWYHRAVEPIDRGTWDEWGYAYRPVRASTGLSNHASGTAIDVNATKYPLGRRIMRAAIKARIAVKLRLTFRATIRAGFTYVRRADEMHYELVANQARVNTVGRAVARTANGRRVLKANPAFARAKGIKL